MLANNDTFLERVREETDRAARTKDPYSLLLLSLDPENTRKTRIARRSLEAMRKSLRCSDCLGWISKDQLGILLPETGNEKALGLKERLEKKMLEAGLSPWEYEEDTVCITFDDFEGLSVEQGLPFEHASGDPEGHTGLRNGRFLERFKAERFRTDRNGRPLSVIFLSLDEIRPRDRLAFQEAMHTFSRSARSFDFWGWHSDRRLAFVLPETTAADAQAVRQRMISSLCASPRLKPYEKQIGNGMMTILEYPDALVRTVHATTGAETAAPALPAAQAETPAATPPVASDADLGPLDEIGTHRKRNRAVEAVEDAVWRVLDLTLALVALVLASPVMLLVAVLVKKTSEGPVLFRQKRVGQHGKTFTFLKFRSMTHNCSASMHQDYVTRFIENRAESYEQDGKKYYKLVHDPRVTPLGKVLRQTALDELPQLWNVLRGEMSLVGPRPPIPYEVVKYKPWHLRRIWEAKPGITGLWQIIGRSTTTFDEQVRLDLEYIEKRSLWLNLWILVRTVGTVIRRQGGF